MTEKLITQKFCEQLAKLQMKLLLAFPDMEISIRLDNKVFEAEAIVVTIKLTRFGADFYCQNSEVARFLLQLVEGDAYWEALLHTLTEGMQEAIVKRTMEADCAEG